MTETTVRALLIAGIAATLTLVPAGCGRPANAERELAVAAFSTIQQVFQHPRCQNCHIPGDAPLQFNAGLPHAMGVVRGPKGHGAEGLSCSTCHGDANPPASYGAHAPPGAPHWGLPSPEHRMAWIGLSARALCELIKDKKRNGGRDFAALITHVSEDQLVAWGWNPGGDRAPITVPREVFIARFKQWAAGGGPCPNQ